MLVSRDIQQCTCTDGQWNLLSSTSTAGCSTVDVNHQHRHQLQQPAAADATRAASVNADDADKRSKNRSAARRCRQNRLERQRAMREQVAQVGAENERLRAKIVRLRGRVDQLHGVLSEHRVHGPCRLNSIAASAAPSSLGAIASTTHMDF